MWYLLSLTYYEEKDKLIPFFEGNEVEEKKESFYAMEEDEESLLEIVYDKLMAFISTLFPLFVLKIATSFDIDGVQQVMR